MALETIIFIFGSLLILTALLGGGFQAKDVLIPQVGNATRAVCAVAGTVFVVLAVLLGVLKNPPPIDPVNPIVQNKVPVRFHVYDELADRQVSEQVRVVISGEVVGTITVSAVHRSAEMLITVPSDGLYAYSLEATAVFLNENNEPVSFAGGGQSTIDVRSGDKFDLAGTISGETWIARLEKRS